eukprot:2148129-Prymnesium_polylepis.1
MSERCSDRYYSRLRAVVTLKITTPPLSAGHGGVDVAGCEYSNKDKRLALVKKNSPQAQRLAAGERLATRATRSSRMRIRARGATRARVEESTCALSSPMVPDPGCE